MIEDDLFNTYQFGSDGSLEPIYSDGYELIVSGKTFLELDSETGIMKLSMSPSDLEIYLEGLGNIPDEGLEYKNLKNHLKT